MWKRKLNPGRTAHLLTSFASSSSMTATAIPPQWRNPLLHPYHFPASKLLHWFSPTHPDLLGAPILSPTDRAMGGEAKPPGADFSPYA
jgi:hypothetical protein